jgi:cysteinyl-tRNA synthetase
MSIHYLGVPFDIHGGGLDLIFPHHEAEIAQAHACFGPEAHHQARFWIHNNLVTIEGQKMSKSLGNFITIEEIFTGRHPKLSRGYPPMALRFLFLQAHYRSTVDFSEEALSAAYKGYLRLMTAFERLKEVRPHTYSSFSVSAWRERVFTALHDDLNTAAALAAFFEQTEDILRLRRQEIFLTPEDLSLLQKTWQEVLIDILGLIPLTQVEWHRWKIAIELLIRLRREARAAKNYSLADLLRDELQNMGVRLLDFPDETLWEMHE